MTAAKSGKATRKVYLTLMLLPIMMVGCPTAEHVIADFTATPRAGDDDLTVTFSGTAEAVPPYRLAGAKGRDIIEYDLSILSWKWNFGDGQIGVGQNCAHVYTEPGVYTVSLTLTVSDGSTAACRKIGHIIVTSSNLPPEPQDLDIDAPEQPQAGDGLSATYVYYDPDGDPETDREIQWYCNDEHVTDFDNEAELPSGTARHGEVWHFMVRVSDGEDWSDWVQSPDITIMNTVPEAQEPFVSAGGIMTKATDEGAPQTGDDLTAMYTYYDADDEPQADVEIHWYKNDEQVTELNNETSVSSELTTKGEEWYFEVRVSDGTDWSEWAQSASVTIANTPPQAQDTEVVHSHKEINGDGFRTVHGLNVAYTYSDLDDDPQDDVAIQWYKNDEHQDGLEGLDLVSSELTAKGENWHFKVQVSDGDDWSEWAQSQTVTILNTAASIYGAYISPYSPDKSLGKITEVGEPQAGDDLWAYHAYDDADGDPEAVTEFQWHKNGEHQPEFDNANPLPGAAVVSGDTWHFIVRANDGEEWTEWLQSDSIEVVNTPPVADAGPDQQIQNSLDPELVAEDFLFYGLTHTEGLGKDLFGPWVSLSRIFNDLSPLTIPALRTIPSQGLGLAAHPETGELWAVVTTFTEPEMGIPISATQVLLAKIDPQTAVMTPVGLLDQPIVDITFDDQGNLYGVTMDSDDFYYWDVFQEIDSSHSLYQISTEDASTQFIIDFGEDSDDYGEAIAYDSATGLLYHMSGCHTEAKAGGFTFQSLDLHTLNLNSVIISGDLYSYPSAMTSVDGALLLGTRDGTLYIAEPDLNKDLPVTWAFSQVPLAGAPHEGLAMAFGKQAQSLIQFDGSGSYDPDDDALTYEWTLTSQPDGSSAQLDGVDMQMPTLTPDEFGDYVAQLTVYDGTDYSMPDSVTVSFTNSPPVANAGPDQIVLLPKMQGKSLDLSFPPFFVWLDGSASSDADFDELEYSWHFVSAPPGSTVEDTSLHDMFMGMDGITHPAPIFVADQLGDYVIELTVSDGGETHTDEVVITVAPDIETVCAQIDALGYGDPGTFTMGPSDEEIVRYDLGPYDPEMTDNNTLYSINCGGVAISGMIDDNFYIGGETRSTEHVFAPWSPYLQTQRYWPTVPETVEGFMGYSIPVESGAYGVQLEFSEIDESITSYGQRVFDVYVEGDLFMDNLDAYALGGLYGNVGSGTGYVLVEDETLDIEFVSETGDPMVSAVLVINRNAQAVTEVVEPYGIGQFEVTNAQYTAVLNRALALGLLENEPLEKDGLTRYSGGDVYYNGQLLLKCASAGEDCDIEFDGRAFIVADREACPDGCETISMDEHPVTGVTWHGALAFCNWYSAMCGLLPFYDLDEWRPCDYYYSKIGIPEEVMGYRLPFEPEWEYAAAWEPYPLWKDLFEEHHWIFGFMSDEIDPAYCNYGDNNPLSLSVQPYTTPVGYYDGSDPTREFAVSPSFCFDMSGNASEWVFGRAQYYPNFDPWGWSELAKGNFTTDERVIRGGSYADSEYYQRTAHRASELPNFTNGKTGFRVARWCWECDFGGF